MSNTSVNIGKARLPKITLENTEYFVLTQTQLRMCAIGLYNFPVEFVKDTGSTKRVFKDGCLLVDEKMYREIVEYYIEQGVLENGKYIIFIDKKG